MKLNTIFTLLCLSFVLDFTNGQETMEKVVDRSHYDYIPETTSFYKLHLDKSLITQAIATCEDEGASLYYPNTKNEFNAVMQFFQTKFKEDMPKQLLLGLNKTEDEFKPIDGTSNSKVYLNWREGEPNNPDTEPCVVLMYPDLTMNNFDCTWIESFICKRTPKSWNEKCYTEDPDYVYSEETGKCYKFHLRPKIWDEAQNTCRSEQSKLAVINSHEEAAYLVRLTRQFIRHVPGRFSRGVVLLGFHNNDVEDWQTDEGTSLYYSGYACWGNNQPDGGEQDRCGSMFYNGHLNDIACDEKAFFICEHDNAALNYVREPNSFYTVIQAVHCHDSI